MWQKVVQFGKYFKCIPDRVNVKKLNVRSKGKRGVKDKFKISFWKNVGGMFRDEEHCEKSSWKGKPRVQSVKFNLI